MLSDADDFSSDTDDGATFRDLMKKHSKIEKRMKYIDEQAKQLKLALELQKVVTDCYSNHVSDFPLITNIELKYLTSGSSVVIFSIRNNSRFDLQDWSICLTVFPSEISAEIGTFSQNIALGSLVPSETFTSELFIPQRYLRLPVLLRLSLSKMFYIANEAKYISIDLGYEYLSLRDQIHQVDDSSQDIEKEQPNIMGNFTLRLPCCLIDLLNGCSDDDDDPVNVLRLLLPRQRFQSLPAGTSSTNALLLSQAEKHQLFIQVTKEKHIFILTINLRDSTLRNRLQQALQTYIILMTLRILKRPLSNACLITNCDTLDELFDSVMSSFST